LAATAAVELARLIRNRALLAMLLRASGISAAGVGQRSLFCCIQKIAILH